MDDFNTASNPTPTPPQTPDPVSTVPVEAPGLQLNATSYDFQALESGIERSLSLKTQKGRDAALATALTPLVESAADSDIALPEGCEMKEVELDDGTTATIPVSVPAEDETTSG